jgi:phosphatidylcholine synthase
MTLSKTRGYLVHLYTMSTLAFVVLGIQWTLEGRYAAALVAMAITLVIDATDGALARRFNIAHTAPGIDGALLDNVVDFTSYVFLPLLFLMHAGMLAQPMTAFAAVVAFSSAFGFSRTSAKQVDQAFFVGFPSYWNVVAFYAYLLGLPATVTTALVLGLSLLVFADVRFLYVSRMRRYRLLHLVLGGAWGVACLTALFLEPGVLRSALIYGSLGYVTFYAVHSVVADVAARRRGPRPARSRGT